MSTVPLRPTVVCSHFQDVCFCFLKHPHRDRTEVTFPKKATVHLYASRPSSVGLSEAVILFLVIEVKVGQ